MKFQGVVWKFGHNIDTDTIVPGKYIFAETEEQKLHTLEVIDPRFAKEVRPGDIVLGGRNFGCGSSRESAARVFRALGVGCVLAESFARIFFRNAIAVGLPVMTVPELWASTAAADTLSADLAEGDVVNLKTKARFQGRPLPDVMLEVVRSGGVNEALRRLPKRKGGAP
jgi:3-isopropylmalate/(R)-2-methylmalate dehydratase small subunit